MKVGAGFFRETVHASRNTFVVQMLDEKFNR